MLAPCIDGSDRMVDQRRAVDREGYNAAPFDRGRARGLGFAVMRSCLA
jgi:hypothetical protein